MEDHSMSVLTCRKTYTDIPWAHRQHKHEGHCAFIHGHNWTITITFGCYEPDANGFVVDFGKLKFLKVWIEKHLDHACVFSADDPMIEPLRSVGGSAVWKTYTVPNCSCEGIARHLFEVFSPMVSQASDGRAFVSAIEVAEDSKNSATFSVLVADHSVAGWPAQSEGRNS
jgi:6-pyruvoyltetrahydropterin/6-carboxytetrahydropterin synthase